MAKSATQLRVPRGLLSLFSIVLPLMIAALLQGADKAPDTSKKAKKKANPKAAPLKTAEEKLALLEKIHKSFPPRSVDVVFTPQDLDKNLRVRMDVPKERFAPPLSDEGFVRRVYLDLTGTLPTAEAIRQFADDDNPRKRAQLIDRLLETPEYARHWGHYWRNVIFHNAPGRRNRTNPQALEDWFAKEFASNTGWDRIVSELISATPRFKKDQKENQFGQDYGPNNFVLAYENDPTDLAAQTARIFMGISIQCAECHDHPFDRWKREQFHEMAAFFAPGKYYMTDMQDPTKKTEMHAKFLLGEKPSPDLKPNALRVAVAAYLVYNPDNYWFARAYVNRIWNELMGDGFYAVDSLGPDKECVYPLVINRLAAVFRYKDFNVKWVFRTIMNSQTYQQEIRTLSDRHELFSAVRPSRLRPDQVVNAMESVAGTLPNRVRRDLARVFQVDPSAPQETLEGSIQQALLLMNGTGLQTALSKADLKSKLVQTKDDGEFASLLYQGILARSPTDAERLRTTAYMQKASSRADGVDDLIWVLVNSTEFVTKR